MIQETMTGWWASGLLIPLLIFLSRVVDVSVGTLRIIFVSRGIRLLSAVLGFFEVLVWLLAITQIMKNLSSPWHYLAYASGFAMGNFVGITVEQKLRMGMLMLRVVTRSDSSALIAALIAEGRGVTTVDAQGATGPVKIIFMVLRRKDMDAVLATIDRFNSNAFYTVEDVKEVSERDFARSRSPEGALLGLRDMVFQKK